MIERDIEKRAAAYVEDLLPDCISLLCRMTAVEAPTGDEGARAELLRSIFLEAGLDDVSIDDIGNVTGIRRGQTRRAILLEAHMDTVFPRGTVTAAPSVIDGEIHCPGVGDNTVGLVTVITALKVLNHLGIQTRHDLIFAGTVREEGLGNLGGIRRLIDTFRNSLDACITVDGFQYQDIVYKGSGIHTERICFNGRGGHSAERDIYPQALLAAAAAADRIGRLPLQGTQTIAVTSFRAGNGTAIHAIPESAELIVNYRAAAPEEYAVIGDVFDDILSSVQAQYGIAFTREVLCDVPCGTQNTDLPLIHMLHGVIEDLGGTVRYAGGGCTNANIPISVGIPAVALGSGPKDYGEHSLVEYMDITHLDKALLAPILLLLRMSSVQETTEGGEV
jgi:tripeptide aminopeptidase